MNDMFAQSSTFLFLEAFSNLVTAHSSTHYAWLARTGSYSIYALLSHITPEVACKLALPLTSALQRTVKPFVFSSCRAFTLLAISSIGGVQISTSLLSRQRLTVSAWQQLVIGAEIQQIPWRNRVSDYSRPGAKRREVDRMLHVQNQDLMSEFGCAQLRRDDGL